MRLFLISPNLADNCDDVAIDRRTAECIEPIAELIVSHIAADPALFRIWHEGEIADPGFEADNIYGSARVSYIQDKHALKESLMMCGDPNSGKWMAIRSLVSCRSVTYGYDGQAFVCLSTNDAPIVSLDPSRIRVEECSEMLAQTDYADGTT